MKCPRCYTENPDTSRFCGSCAAELGPEQRSEFSATETLETPVRTISEGTLVARKYRIIEEIGRGGMGIVYKAEDTKLKREVALKFLPHQWTADPIARERFIHEAQAASALDHPHICTIHEIEETADGRMYIAMAFYEGESLRDKIKRGPMGTEEAVEIIRQVAQGMAKANEKGIVHRDLKPANILITKDGLAKIVDFGLAKLAGQVQLTREGTTIGTVAYMSPEQARGEAVDWRTDIWSLGVVLYEILAGQLPFKGDLEQSLIHSILKAEPEPLTKFRKDLPPGLSQIIAKSLAKNPAVRYQTMDELLEDLKAVADGLKPLLAKPGILRGRVLGIRKVYFYPGLVAVVILAAFTILVLLPTRGEALGSIAVLPFENISGDPGQENFADVLTELVTADLYKISGLSVKPNQSVRKYKKSEKSLKEIAKELDVKSILSCSVLRSGNRVKLIAHLIDPAKDVQIWAQPFEKEMSDIYFLQSDLSQAIVSGIKVVVSPLEKALLASARKVIPEALDLYLKAHYAVWVSGEWNMQIVMKGIEDLEQAVKIDPNYAQAYAELGADYHDLAANNFMPAEEAYRKAERAALKALELDETLAGPRDVLGWIKCSRDWNISAAEKELKKALELEPGNDDIQWSYNVFLNAVGKSDEAIARQKPIEESKTTGYLNALGFFYLCAGRYKEGLEEAKRAAERNPSPWNDRWLVLAYGSNGMYAEALSLMNEIMTPAAAKEDSGNVSMLAWILALSGRREEALAAMGRLKTLKAKTKTDSSVEAAKIYAALGDKNKAFELLNKAFEQRIPNLFIFSYFPEFHGLRDDPRYDELLRRMGFKKSP